MRTVPETAAAIMAPGRSMLVLDEYADRLLENSRQAGSDTCAFAELVLTTPELGHLVSAILMTESTFAGTTAVRRQPEFLASGTAIGVRMSISWLDGDIASAVMAQAESGAAFVEWRANLGVSDVPRGSTHIEAAALARGALAAQAAGILPVLSVALPDLPRSSLAVSQAATTNALVSLHHALDAAGVDHSGLLVRVNMATPGPDHPRPAAPDVVARATLDTLLRGVAPATAGVLLLSGGQPLDQACANVRAILTRAAELDAPWAIAPAFSRALVGPAARVFDGVDSGPPRQALLKACQDASYAVLASAPRGIAT